MEECGAKTSGGKPCKIKTKGGPCWRHIGEASTKASPKVGRPKKSSRSKTPDKTWLLKDLKEYAKTHGIKISGKKDEIIQAIKSHVEEKSPTKKPAKKVASPKKTEKVASPKKTEKVASPKKSAKKVASPKKTEKVASPTKKPAKKVASPKKVEKVASPEKVTSPRKVVGKVSEDPDNLLFDNIPASDLKNVKSPKPSTSSYLDVDSILFEGFDAEEVERITSQDNFGFNVAKKIPKMGMKRSQKIGDDVLILRIGPAVDITLSLENQRKVFTFLFKDSGKLVESKWFDNSGNLQQYRTASEIGFAGKKLKSEQVGIEPRGKIVEFARKLRKSFSK